MKLEPLTKEQCEKVRIWRNQIPESLRTPYPLTREQQEKFYEQVICNRNSPHRYWAIMKDCGDLRPDRECNHFIGMGGIINIQWQNRIAEISLILGGDWHKNGEGDGKKAVELLLDQAFNYLNLQTVFGEVYHCNEKAANFWLEITRKYQGKTSVLRNRKFWKDQYHNSRYFSIDRDDFNKN